jgi:hypothetical protein
MDRGTIVDALAGFGITYLDGGYGLPVRIPDAELIRALAESGDTRLKLSLIPLLLTRPSIAELVPGVVRQTATAHGPVLTQLYTAAACLQRFWFERFRRNFEQLKQVWFASNSEP